MSCWNERRDRTLQSDRFEVFRGSCLLISLPPCLACASRPERYRKSINSCLLLLALLRILPRSQSHSPLSCIRSSVTPCVAGRQAQSYVQCSKHLSPFCPSFSRLGHRWASFEAFDKERESYGRRGSWGFCRLGPRCRNRGAYCCLALKQQLAVVHHRMPVPYHHHGHHHQQHQWTTAF